MKLTYKILVAFTCLLLACTSLDAQSNTKEINYEGLKIIYKKTPKQVVTASLFIKGGTANVSVAQQGIEAVALQLAMSGGTKTMNRDAFANKADQLGTRFSAMAAKDFSSVTMTCLQDNWAESWAMFTDAVQSPAMDKNEFETIKGQMIAGAKQRESDPDSYLRKMAADMLFSGSDYAKSANGTAASLEKLTVDDAAKYYAQLPGKKKCYLVVVGNIDEQDLLDKIKNTLAKLPVGAEAKKPSYKSVAAPAVNIKDRDIATNYILGVLNAPKYYSADGPLFEFAMNILSDRYFLELRSKRSLSYAPYTYYDNNTIQQPLSNLYISTINPKQSLKVMTDIINDITKNGFTNKEVKDKKEQYLTNYYMTNEASSYQAAQLGFCEASGNWKLFDEINNKIGEVRTDNLNRTFNQYMKTVNWNYLGKKEKVTKADFKQLLPVAEKLPPARMKKMGKQG